jgi:L-asparaginase
MNERARIAHLAGPMATIQNTPPLFTSNKSRAKYALPPVTHADGSAQRYDTLRAQRLAAPAIIHVEQFSAHPLEADAAELYGPPDGYLDATGTFHTGRTAASDKPVYQIELRPRIGSIRCPTWQGRPMAAHASGDA